MSAYSALDFGEGVDVAAEIAQGADDLGYVDAMLAELGEQLCIDEGRVYATGLSNGAMFTSLLACERADVLAAAVMVAGIEDPAGCEPEPVDTQISDEVIHRVWDCPPGADVEFTIVVGGGHSWPASEFSTSIAAIVGHTTFDVDGTVDGWASLRRFNL